MPKPLILMTPPWFLMVFRYLTRTVPGWKILQTCFKINHKSMKILLKIRLKKQYIFISARGCQRDSEIDEKGCPIKTGISRVRPQKHENLRHFRESIAKFLEKTRVFDVPGPPRPLSTSKKPSGPQFGHKMDPTGSSSPRKCGIFAVPSAKT